MTQHSLPATCLLAGSTQHRKMTLGELLVVFLVLVVVLLAHACYYMPFFSDDALISLRYLERFLQGYGLTWTDGIRVEGYSNLLWILLLSGFGVFNVDLIAAARISGIAGMAVVMLSALLFYTKAGTLKQVWLPLLTGLLFFCLAAPTAVWAIGGLEQPLIAALLAIAIPLCIAVVESRDLDIKKTLLASFTLGLMCLTRPDGPIFTVAVVAAMMITAVVLAMREQLLRRLFALLVFPAAFYIGQTAFRIYYYGELVPNTALVKLVFSLPHFIVGMQYVGKGLLSLSPFSFFAIAALFFLLRRPQSRARAILLLCMTVLWLVYVAVIGGDIFPAWRHLIPVVVIFTFAIIDGTFLLGKFFEKKKIFHPAAIAAGLVVLFASYLWLQFNHPKNKKAVYERWEWDGQVIGLLLKKAFSTQQPLIAVTAAGCLPYWSELPALDMLGLNDYYLPRHPPKNLGRGSIGHELGSGAYVMERAPDIVIFHVGLHDDVFRSGQEMQKTDAFYENYAAVNVLGTQPHRYHGILWFRKYSHKIGIQQTASAIVVPGFLLNANPKTVAYLDNRDELVVSVVKGQDAGLDIAVPLSKEWQCQVVASDADITCKLENRGESSNITVTTSSEYPVAISKIVLNKRSGP